MPFKQKHMNLVQGQNKRNKKGVVVYLDVIGHFEEKTI
jgi:hypothetical protein